MKLLADASALESWIGNEVPNELRFNVEAAIINGDGVGKPLGILQSGSLISATRTDGSKIDAYDIGRMWARRLTGYNDYVWFVNPACLPAIAEHDHWRHAQSTHRAYDLMFPLVHCSDDPLLRTNTARIWALLATFLLASPSAYALITKGGN